MRTRLLFCALVAGNLGACGDGGPHGGNGGASGGTGLGGLGGLGGSGFNQCGVAAPRPSDAGHCTAVSAPTIADFDDYTAGTAASSYTYYINGKPPAGDAVLGAFQHIDDGSGSNGGTSVITTEMVTGEGNTGYAVQVSDSNAMNWGGILLFYFPSNGATTACLNAQSASGLEFSIKGSSPSGRIGVSLGMLDTIAVEDKGLCDNATATDCKNASVESSLVADAATWTHVQLPWSALTPGVGSGRSCVPVTGQNIVQLAIQPLMNYPPPNYTLAPGPYTIAVDNVRFY